MNRSRPVAALLLGSLLLAPLAASASVPQFEIVEISPTLGLDAVPGKAAPEVPGGSLALESVPDPAFLHEVEPNGTSGTATPIPGSSARILANVYPAADVDFFSFTAAAGDRVYAATQTLFDASASGDSVLDLLGTDGSTVLESDNNDGTFNASSSSIAGTAIPAAGTYFLRVRHNVATGTIRPYHLYLQLQSGAPVAEVEPNNTPATANPLPASGWVSGTIDPAADVDYYSVNLTAGDTVFLSLDLDPERDAVAWNGRLGFALFGNPPANQILVANDASATSPNSEAFFFTVKDSGTYFAYVDHPTGVGGPTQTYQLSVSVRPQVAATANCTTYTSTDVPQTIPAGPGIVSSTITVPGNPRVADLDVSINLNHTFMQDLDVHLRSPAGNDNGLFTDIGAATVGGLQTLMDIRLDDEAALPPAFAVTASMVLQPELAYRLAWFDGIDAGGTWTLDIRDDATGDGGTLNAWSLTICEPAPPPACPAGFAPQTVYSSDFETGDGGFTHSGVQDEWERGLPTFNPLTTCASGTNCWVTDLDNSYNASSNQDLLSPAINLAGLSAPVVVRWQQRYHMESASFDKYTVDIREAGGANPTRLFEWLDATMNSTVGNPSATIAESAGWGPIERRADAYAGQNVELLFNLNSDTTVQLAGAAIDDVSVTACRPLTADLSITKTDGVATAVPGTNTTYTIVASNAGPDPVTGASVADIFPAACTSVSWTCVGAGGGTCTAAGAGNLNDAVNLPPGASVTYTAICTISPAATGNLANTATVASAVTDPNPANNAATDTDTLTPQADLAITKTDGVATAAPGANTTYTIVAGNAGPSAVPAATVADTFPAACTSVTWSCVGAGGGTCTANGSGNLNDGVSLPVGGSVTFTAICAISPAASGTLSNTATVASATTDPVPGNNSATDTTDLLSPADVTGTKTASGSFSPGGTVTYTVVLTNASASPQLDNPGDEFTDTLPTGVTYAGGASATSGTIGVAGAVVSWNGSIPGNGSVTLTIPVTIDAGTLGQTITNQGTVFYDADGDGTNESQRDTDDPGLPGGSDPTSFTVAGSVLEIPTLSGLGLAALAFALALLALALLRRRQAA
ncbi:MAG: proprotein convertase P-domain-containing protein [Thermoanaerobaculia bacterium]|nr:proprotein convertase P-domain-containing protein [Thermoanaerobaculia bacterium]